MRVNYLSLETAIMFFSLCQKLDLKTQEEREFLLDQMYKAGALDKVYETDRTKEQFIEDISRNFNVLRMEW